MKAKVIFGAILCTILLAIYIMPKIIISVKQKSNLAAVGLPTKDGYDGGYYPKWSPIKFTYKDYKGEPSIDSPEFETISLRKLMDTLECSPIPLLRFDLDKLDELAETDPDAMFAKYFHTKFVDLESAMPYLMKAAEMGHVVANIELTEYMEDGEEKSAILEAYAKITPFKQDNVIFELIDNDKLDVLESFMANSDQFIWLVATAYRGLQYDDEMIRFSPNYKENTPRPFLNYKDYWCEAYYRGCLMGNIKFQCEN